TDRQKALDAQLRASNQTIAGLAVGINSLDEQYKRLGKTASQNTAIDIEELQPKLEQAKDKVRQLRDQIFDTKYIATDLDAWDRKLANEALPGLNDQLGVAQKELEFFEKQMRNLKEIFSEQEAAEVSATRQGASEQQIVTVQNQQNRIDTTRLGSQEVVADYQKSFVEINAATQQFNDQQLSILMTGINKTSTQVVLSNQNTSKKIEADEAASLSRRQKLWDQTFKGISGAFNTFISGIISRHQTLSQAWTKLVDGMVAKFIEGLEK